MSTRRRRRRRRKRRREGTVPVLTFVHIESDSPDRDPDHALWVVEKLNGLRVQGKIISVLEAWETESADVNTPARTSHSERRGAAADSLLTATHYHYNIDFSAINTFTLKLYSLDLS